MIVSALDPTAYVESIREGVEIQRAGVPGRGGRGGASPGNRGGDGSEGSDADVLVLPPF